MLNVDCLHKFFNKSVQRKTHLIWFFALDSLDLQIMEVEVNLENKRQNYAR